MKTRKIIVVAYYSAIAVLLVFWGVLKYRDFRCANSFGPEFNKRRKELRIPIIPSGWKVYNTENTSTAWEARKVSRGHGFKVVIYDGCEIDGEEDHYYFSSKKIQDTVLTVEYWYANKHRCKDSTIFTFQIGHHGNTITGKQADSIFIANNIDKDL